MVGTAIKTYGGILAKLDKGNGIKFLVPWIALYPFPNPIYVLPKPM